MALAPQQGFRALSTHDGLETDTYELTIDGVLTQAKPVAERGDVMPGAIAFDVASGLTSGAYQLQIHAVGHGGKASSPILTLIVTQAPSPPGPIQIVVL